MALPENKRLLSPQQTHWIPLSDLMTGLMMVFLLVSIAYMVQAEADKSRAVADRQRIAEVARLYRQLQLDLYEDLRREFEKDLPRWGAELDQMTIRFREPDVLFDTGRDTLKPRFKEILDDFWPRYVRILTSEKYRDSIEEVRIEGHTSSFWHGTRSEQEAYFRNMELSQARTRTTLTYVMGLEEASGQLPWLRKHVTANGLSSARTIANADGNENVQRSQRVEFRVRTNAESRIAEILELAPQ
jgi:outer membrane protein OmpA-like peptidoglycan-associated protein